MEGKQSAQKAEIRVLLKACKWGKGQIITVHSDSAKDSPVLTLNIPSGNEQDF